MKNKRESEGETNAKVRRKGKREEGRPVVVPWRAIYGTVHFFLRFSFLPFPSHRPLRLPLSSFFPSSFVPLRLRRHGGCTRVRTRAPSSSFADSFRSSPLFASFFPLLLLSCCSLFLHVRLLLHRRRTFVHVPVHSFVKSPLASSGHVAHAATKRGRNERTVMVAQVKMANDSFVLPFYPLCRFFQLLFILRASSSKRSPSSLFARRNTVELR